MYHNTKKRTFDDFYNNNIIYNIKYDLIDYLLDNIHDNFNIRPKSI